VGRIQCGWPIAAAAGLSRRTAHKCRREIGAALIAVLAQFLRKGEVVVDERTALPE